MDKKRIAAATKRFLGNNFLYIATAVCIFCAIELMRVPSSYSTIIRLIMQSPSRYDLSEILSHLAIQIADSLILALPALFVRKRAWILFLWIFIIDVFGLIQTWYITVYQDYMPVSHLFLFGNVNTVLLKSAIGLMQPRDVLFFVPLAAFIAIYLVLKRCRSIGKSTIRKKIYIPSVIAFLLLFSLFVSLVRTREDRSDGRSMLYQYIAPASNWYFMVNHGLTLYTVSSVIRSLPSWGISDEERAEVAAFLSQRKNYTDNTYAAGGQKNLILIVVESFNSWYLNRTVNGVEIMPNLNRMLKEPGTLSALKVLPQAKDGRSSDGQFIINAGLLPLKSGAVAISYSKNEFPSLAKALKTKGYNTNNIACDDSVGWNQGGMSRSLGFDRFFCRTNYGYSPLMPDSAMLMNGLKEMRTFKQPFMMQLVTIDTNQPAHAQAHPTALSKFAVKRSLSYAMEDFHELDSHIELFIDGLKKAGLYDNSVLVIASDHDDLGFNEFEGRKDKTASDRFCTFIVLNSGQTLHYTDVSGQIDIYPTILDIMGCNGYWWKGLGHSLLRNPKPDCAAHCAGMEAGNPDSPIMPYPRTAWDRSELIRTGNYFAPPTDK